MKNFRKKTIAGIFALCAFGMHAQFSPQYQQVVTVTEPYNMTLTDYPALIIVDTQSPISNGIMQPNGEDIRFTGCGLAPNYDYWIESGINTTATRIWVRIPQLLPNASTSFLMSYGDPAAAATSSFSSTFPTALTTSGNVTLSGNQEIGWLHVQAGDTLFVNAGTALNIISGYARIDGVVMAAGAGYTAPGFSSAGNGTGGGGFSNNSGCGGGSYGGVGGTGGYDAGDTPGAGGSVYGTQTGTDIDMGSAGGSSDNSMGTSGGGMFVLRGTIIYVTGEINADGTDVPLPGGSRGGGGGAGGGIMLLGDSIVMTGTLTAKGGDGSVGTSTANDSGGGGGGGRTKMFYDAGILNTGTSDASGGVGGPYGSPAATNGQPGTTYDGTWTFTEATIAAAMAFNPASYNETNSSICVLAPAFTLTAGTPTGGTYSGTGVTGSTFDPSVAGAGTHNVVYTFVDGAGCTSTDTSQIIVNTDVAVSYIETLGTICVTDAPYALATGSPAGGTYAGNGVSGNTIDPAVAGLGTHDVVYTVTDVYGCTGDDTAQVVVDACLGIQSVENGKLRIFPNPAQDQLTLNISFDEQDNMQLRIVNTLGELVMEKNISGVSNTIDVHDLAPGVYTVTLLLDGGMQKSTRVVISK